MLLRPRKQKGTILIVALLVFSLIEIVLLGMMEYHGFELLHTKDLKDHQQRMQLLLSGEKWAVGLLKEVAANEEIKDQAIWTLEPTQTPWGRLEITVEDLHTKVNINNATFGTLPGVENFLKYILPEIKTSELQSLVPFLSGRITPLAQLQDETDLQDFNDLGDTPIENIEDLENLNEEQLQQLQALGALDTLETQEQESLPDTTNVISYLSITELLENAEISSETFKALEGYLCAISDKLPININTAPMPVLMSLHPQMTESLANLIIETRAVLEGFQEASDMTKIEALKELKINTHALTTQSQYYRAQIKLIFNKHEIKLYTWLARTSAKDYIEIQILKRSFGTL